jgi:menaquinone-dependent protoporphyrinogen oxidase
MKTGIIYDSQHGTCEKLAAELAKGTEQAVIIKLHKKINIDLTEFDQIIVGGSIHAGNIQQTVKAFCENHTHELLTKPLGLFLCGMHDKEMEAQFHVAYPDVLRKHAKSKHCFGGEFRFDKMNFFERMIVKRIAKVKETTSKIDYGAVEQMKSEMFKN